MATPHTTLALVQNARHNPEECWSIPGHGNVPSTYKSQHTSVQVFTMKLRQKRDMTQNTGPWQFEYARGNMSAYILHRHVGCTYCIFSTPLGSGAYSQEARSVYYVCHVYKFDEKGTALFYFIISDLSMLMLSTSSSLGGNRHMHYKLSWDISGPVEALKCCSLC